MARKSKKVRQFEERARKMFDEVPPELRFDLWMAFRHTAAFIMANVYRHSDTPGFAARTHHLTLACSHARQVVKHFGAYAPAENLLRETFAALGLTDTNVFWSGDVDVGGPGVYRRLLAYLTGQGIDYFGILLEWCYGENLHQLPAGLDLPMEFSAVEPADPRYADGHPPKC